MDKKIRSIVLVFVFYAVIFWVGFRSGEIYNRIKKGYKAEKVVIPDNSSYYVVEDRDYGTYHYTDVRICGSGDPLIQILNNEKLKPILKEKTVQIYRSSGDRIY